MSKRKPISYYRVDVLLLEVVWGTCETGLVKGVHFKISEDWASDAELRMAGVAGKLRWRRTEGPVKFRVESTELRMLHRYNNSRLYNLRSYNRLNLLPEKPNLKLVTFYAVAFSNFFLGESTSPCKAPSVDTAAPLPNYLFCIQPF